MLEVKDLTKIYSTKSADVVALDKVSFKAPSKGMIFIVGKSGCGKTTLLNAIGGLDHFNKGDILVNGKRLSKYSVTDLDNYRNYTIGFIFQDFCLINGLNVKNNIKMSLQLQNSKKKIKYNKFLSKFGIEGLGYRYPSQLSAGQKQRVAIARAVVKDPSIILADEPTGNLDEHTSTQIMDLLKEESKNRLIIIISHNLEEANKYADRILEMSDGKIISDKTINNEYLEHTEVHEDKALIASDGYISNDDLNLINEKVKKSNGNYEIIQAKEKFVTNDLEITSDEISTKKVKMNNLSKIKYSAFFFKKKLFFNLFMILLITAVASFLSIIELLGLNDFNKDTIRLYEHQGIENTVLTYNDDLNTYIDSINVEQTNQLLEKYNYEAKYIYSITMPLLNKYNSFTQSGASPQSARNYGGYLYESSGVVITNEEKLKKQVNDGKDLVVLAGQIKQDGVGVIITDYFADSIIHNVKTINTYEDIINSDLIAETFKVDAIIKTNFNEKYPQEGNFLKHENKAIQSAYKSNLLYDYGVCYTYNNNFIEEYKTFSLEKEIAYSRFTAMNLQPTNSELQYAQKQAICYYTNTLKEDEIELTYSFFNKISPISFSDKNVDKFQPTKVTLTLYDYEANEFINKEFTVTKIYKQRHTYEVGRLSGQYYFDAVKDQYSAKQLVVESQGDLYEIITLLTKNNFTNTSSSSHITLRTIDLLTVFKNVFKFITFVIIFALFLIIVLNASVIIKHNVYEIGVMKALGCKTKDLITIFVAQMILTSITVCILLYASSNIFVNFANELLCSGIGAYVRSTVNLPIILFSNKFFVINIVSISAFTIISIVVPILAIRRIKPLKIIKTRN